MWLAFEQKEGVFMLSKNPGSLFFLHITSGNTLWMMPANRGRSAETRRGAVLSLITLTRRVSSASKSFRFAFPAVDRIAFMALRSRSLWWAFESCFLTWTKNANWFKVIVGAVLKPPDNKRISEMKIKSGTTIAHSLKKALDDGRMKRTLLLTSTRRAVISGAVFEIVLFSLSAQRPVTETTLSLTWVWSLRTPWWPLRRESWWCCWHSWSSSRRGPVVWAMSVELSQLVLVMLEVDVSWSSENFKSSVIAFVRKSLEPTSYQVRTEMPRSGNSLTMRFWNIWQWAFVNIVHEPGWC